MDAPLPLTKQKQRTRLSGPERRRVADELRAHYDAGASIREIAEKTATRTAVPTCSWSWPGTEFRGRGMRGSRRQRGH